MNIYSTRVKKLAVITTLLFAYTVMSPANAFSTTTNIDYQQQANNQQEVYLSDAELAQALAPIALYPDTLLTHILIASTYPIEVIEADRWLNQKLQENSQLSAQQLEVLAEDKDWDVSIQALLSFPKVLNKLSDDLSWMQNIGDAFLQDEARVLTNIQTLRQQAEQAGSLDNINNVKIVKEQQTIIIEPAQAEIIYVPYYDTRVVYGRWHWSNYPPVYWRNPYRYASSYGSNYGHFYWGSAVRISTHFYFSAFHWQKRHVVVTPHINYRQVSGYSSRNRYYSNRKIVTSNQAKRWNHKPTHRRGVAYNHKKVQQRYHGSRSNVHSTNTYKRNLSRNATQKTTHKTLRDSRAKVNTQSTIKRKSNHQKLVVRTKNHHRAEQKIERKLVKKHNTEATHLHANHKNSHQSKQYNSVNKLRNKPRRANRHNDNKKSVKVR
ncbi:DUF3300 domain-containing protein [Colwellia sp. E2M01]|uniref:DUF3300 domain-containing protein n=1 Tax=Colwellia sp. E2M01 TaxID=2841561 RepID=UPI001C0A19C5|nr:DUF3300 domain-containing protein [Colwellia sp. E2M01]MBU2870013.1 DUF3300 domain-containing protein [Colwellia sp. E2M01]